MLVLLPPSETKRAGGDGPPLDLSSLSFPALTARRRAAVSALVELSRDEDAAVSALKLGPRLVDEVERNRTLRRTATMPAIDRFTGVLFDALDAGSLTSDARELARTSVVVHSALFGLLGALDPVPAYRLSADSRLRPGPRAAPRSLLSHWAAPVTKELAAVGGPILDLRSESYVALGPVPEGVESAYVRVVTDTGDGSGTRRALNHFNKAAKGRLVRDFLMNAVDFPSIDALLDWAALAGWNLQRTSPEELELVV
ncbi:YaaA family protein [Compostimonas suwonensis]|uniref:Peroxide stress protein YaaA n=1 Tax=Compostimonas suwonensis TaxID=1048394 RepID=A0A2M9BUG0_9MICO|nr:peroxide stress protein YaaA [Compostimonas suwonensis]PJJ61579.1 hypothetical protein CLV54_2525 [Compostimonas suwonensis]